MLRTNARLLLVAIEPNDTFERLRATVSRLPGDVRSRARLLNLAIGPSSFGPYATLHKGAWRDGGCSSLMRVSRDAQWATRHHPCTRLVHNVTVPVVTLGAVLRKLPPRLSRHVKIDAQGLDLAILRSAGTQLCTVSTIQAEMQDVPRGSPLLLYEGQPIKGDVVAFLNEYNFALQHCTSNNDELREQNCVFHYRRPAPATHPKQTRC